MKCLLLNYLSLVFVNDHDGCLLWSHKIHFSAKNVFEMTPFDDSSAGVRELL